MKKTKNYFNEYCPMQCKYENISCDNCPATELAEIMQDVIYDLNDENIMLQREINDLRRLSAYGEDEYWHGEIR